MDSEYAAAVDREAGGTDSIKAQVVADDGELLLNRPFCDGEYVILQQERRHLHCYFDEGECNCDGVGRPLYFAGIVQLEDGCN